MITIDLTERKVKEFIESKRPSLEIRNQIDIGYSYTNKTVEIHEIRPQWDDTTITHKYPMAKAK